VKAAPGTLEGLKSDFVVIALGGSSGEKLISSIGSSQEGHSKAIDAYSQGSKTGSEPELALQKGRLILQ
jgi:hypothetical protein